jgi:Ser/Thr protein kinase RdoA (MazF antagonist)
MGPVVHSTLEAFAIKGKLKSIKEISQGLINKTYRLEVMDSGVIEVFILQKINQRVLSNLDELQDNITRILRHVAAKKKPLGEVFVKMRTTPDGESLFRESKDAVWRLFEFIKGTATVDIIENTGQAFEAGRIFGEFNVLLEDLPSPPLHITIPGFHDTSAYYRLFEKARSANPVSALLDDFRFLESKKSFTQVLDQLFRQDLIQKKICHGDTKVSNILFDESQKSAVCVVDFDTVMPGFWLWDFGDLARSATCPVREDEKDLSKVKFNSSHYDALTKGYLSVVGSKLNEVEKAHLAFSARLLTFECALRFLTDHLEGDKYFPVTEPGQNLNRFRVQRRLLESMEDTFSPSY